MIPRKVMNAIVWLLLWSFQITTASHWQPPPPPFNGYYGQPSSGGPPSILALNDPLPAQQQLQHPDAAYSAPPYPPERPEESFSLPEINLHDLSLSLRLAGELNRRLSSPKKSGTLQQQSSLTSDYYGEHSHPTFVRGGSGAVQVQDSHTPPPLTIFHASSPRPSKGKTTRRGAARWGPDLEAYLTHILEDVLQLPNDSSLQQQRVLVLAMIYLDRACAVDTVRPPHIVKCPYVTPRTVHRLVLTSVLLAHSVSLPQPQQNDVINRVSDSLGISQEELELQLKTMYAALGEAGLTVAPHEWIQWGQAWNQRTFQNAAS